jgi:iodotyrosine deiodinase
VGDDCRNFKPLLPVSVSIYGLQLLSGSPGSGSSKHSESADDGAVGGPAFKSSSEVVLPTSSEVTAASVPDAAEIASKGRGLDELSFEGIATPFRAWQEGTPSAEGHIDFKYEGMDASASLKRSEEFHALLNLRRSVRFYDRRPIPDGVLERCVAAAVTAPSGAHMQPWAFIIVRSPEARRAIRLAVEEEERINYAKRMRKGWVDDVAPLVSSLHAGGDIQKPYIEHAPGLVVVMEQPYGRNADGSKRVHYYPKESVGIAAGMFIAAVTNAGLFTLTSTPMGAESSIRTCLGRPSNERVFLLMPVGFPSSDATVPHREPGALRKPLSETAIVV